MDKRQKKRIIERYKELLQFYFRTENKELDVDDKPFTNFLEVLYPVISCNKYYSNDIFMSSISWYLENMNELPGIIGEQQIDDLIEYINKTFNINKEMHYLIFPLQGSGLKQDICFSNFHLLTEKSEDDIINQISDITSIEKNVVNDFLDHTKMSRSRDFLKANIMIIKIENQTQNVMHSAYQIAQYSVNFFLLIYSAFGFKSSIFRLSEIWEKENRHVAILSRDGWRCGHGFNWEAHLQCKIDLDFMTEKKYQNIFDNLLNSLALHQHKDDLTYKFENSFILYSRGSVQRRIQNDDSLALLLYITALESLITEGQQKKRIRLATIIPSLISINGFTTSELETIIDELYKERNNFVHAGKKPLYSYKNNKLELLDRIVALILLKYLDIDSLLGLSLDQTRLNMWSEYLDKVFNNSALE